MRLCRPTPHSVERLVGESLTFLRDADGAAAHPYPQAIHACINQVLRLGSCYHCSRQREPQRHMQSICSSKYRKRYKPLYKLCNDAIQVVWTAYS